MKLLSLFALLFILVLAGAIGAVLFAMHDPNDRLMTDDELIRLFRTEHASFDSLATMFAEDPAITFADGYRVRVPGDTVRAQTYERLLRRVRCGRNIWIDSTGILFQQYVNKYASDPRDRWMRGYWYARGPIRGRVLTTDLLTAPGFRPPPYEPYTDHRPLGGDWYLYTVHGYTD